VTKKVIRLLVVDDDETILDRIIEHFRDRFTFDGVPVEMI
jgi:hypothetical protein